MPWIPHLMVLDDDPRVLDSLVPGFANELAQAIGRSVPAAAAVRRGDGGGPSTSPQVKITAHGYESERLGDYRYRSPHHVHLHLVRERGGRFDLARRLLNEQLFAVVVSDLRFSDEAGGLRAGQLFVDEVHRVHPEVQGILSRAPRGGAVTQAPSLPPDRRRERDRQAGAGGAVPRGVRPPEGAPGGRLV
ncbi:MAG: hypothetical protein LC745_04960 [Planctomycetia bacterium]|nr:hypothetical protein [Planctomycetia bacterium]